MKIAALALIAAGFLSAASPRVLYSKSFPGSSPAYIGITVDKEGRLEYREDVKDDNPFVIQLSPAEVAEVFTLADKLDHFKHPIESGLKVANMGAKTFRYEDGADAHEVKFNYSLDADAKLLHDWFERVSETEQYYAGLDRTMRFDKLGVNQALLHLQSAMERKRIIGSEQFLPLLDKLIKNQTIMHMARERAEQMAAAIRAEKNPSAPPVPAEAK